MILQALHTYYQRLLARGEEGLAPFGYSPEKISYEIVLTSDGKLVAVNDIRDTSGKKPLPRLMIVPQPEKRTMDVKSNFLWDKTSYVLGVSASSAARQSAAECQGWLCSAWCSAMAPSCTRKACQGWR